MGDTLGHLQPPVVAEIDPPILHREPGKVQAKGKAGCDGKAMDEKVFSHLPAGALKFHPHLHHRVGTCGNGESEDGRLPGHSLGLGGTNRAGAQPGIEQEGALQPVWVGKGEGQGLPGVDGGGEAGRLSGG